MSQSSTIIDTEDKDRVKGWIWRNENDCWIVTMERPGDTEKCMCRAISAVRGRARSILSVWK